MPTSVVCVDDNPHVTAALQTLLARAGFDCRAVLDSAADLADRLAAHTPDVTLMDIDMPGPDPIDALADIAARGLTTRVLIFSGHVSPALIGRAIDAGAWGYVSKNDGEHELLAALRAVAAGEFALSPEARQTMRRLQSPT